MPKSDALSSSQTLHLDLAYLYPMTKDTTATRQQIKRHPIYGFNEGSSAVIPTFAA
jgi:hypothetical protein